MWISRKEYKFLKENAEKNINAECEILNIKDEQNQKIARALEEFSSTLTELDRYKIKCSELHTALIDINHTCKTVDRIIDEIIKTEKGEESNMIKFDDITSCMKYMKNFNDIIKQYTQEKLDEFNPEG